MILDEFNTMLSVTPPPFEYMKNAMLLGLVTAQRQGTLAKCSFLTFGTATYVEQIKTGAKVAIYPFAVMPLA